ncbi:protein of unknown function [Blastococcus saxobsidens DD2]|uniref:Uncharacterized protein n=1 Tax=Blastococcus saxobsidens (strain DD2) TaxID=1146883 RepID=H6RKI4_BLASD|nr:protein of unknown function [Blastococcus saxobsidens DD2]
MLSEGRPLGRQVRTTWHNTRTKATGVRFDQHVERVTGIGSARSAGK